MKSLEYSSNSDARESISLACRLYGQKRGWAVAADLLGITERTARAITYGETNGASVDPITALETRNALRRARADQLRAELRELEHTHVENRTSASAPMGACQ
jgi:hypothetical protein